MTPISRRAFLKRTLALSSGAILTIYADGSYRLALAAQPAAYQLRILHTNDHHARIEPVSLTIGRAGDQSVSRSFGGVARRKTLVDQLRAAATTDLLLLDAGDVFQGTLYFNQYLGQADLTFYNLLGYDAVTVGNHEFDRGAQPLADFIAGAQFPLLSANLTIAGGSPLAGLLSTADVTPAGRLGPRTIISKGSEQIGIFGLTPEDTGILSNPGPDVAFTPAIEAARAQVAALKAAGATRIIGLTHVGYNNDQLIATQVDGIDLIVGGHSHTPLLPDGVSAPVGVQAAGPYPTIARSPSGRPVVIVTDWEWGKWLGDMTLGFGADGSVSVVEGQVHPVWAELGSARDLLAGEQAEIAADPGFQGIIDGTYKPALDILRSTRVGATSVALDGDRANVRSRETNLGNLIADALLAKLRADGGQLAIINGGGIRTSIPQGDVTVGQVLEVLPFGNTIARVDLNGAQIKAALENGVSQVETGAGRFPQVGGLRFKFNLRNPAGDRVNDIEVATATGYAPLDPATTYRVVTNNFMLTGGDGYSVFRDGANGVDTGFILADVVQEYIAANSPVSPRVEQRIVETSGTTAAPVPAPAPAPVTLPNTAGAEPPLWWVAALGLGALGSGALLRRRLATVEAAKQEEASL